MALQGVLQGGDSGRCHRAGGCRGPVTLYPSLGTVALPLGRGLPGCQLEHSRAGLTAGGWAKICSGIAKGMSMDRKRNWAGNQDAGYKGPSRSRYPQSQPTRALTV